MPNDIRWIYLSVGLFDDEKIQIIESMPDCDSIIVIWIKLLTLAGKCNDQGYIYVAPGLAYTEETLASVCRRPLLTVRLALATFTNFGMITIEDNGKIFLNNWAKWQSVAGMDHIRELGRERIRKFREGKKQLQLTTGQECNVTRNVTVTHKNKNKNKNKDIDNDRDNSITKEKEISKEKESGSHIIFNFINRESWNEFKKMRVKIKAPLTDHAEYLLLNRLNQLRIEGDNPDEVINQSVMNSWKGFYALKGTKKLDDGSKFKRGKYAHMVQS